MSQKLLAMKPLPPRVAECTVQSADARADAGSKGRARGPAGRCSPTPGSRRPVPPCSTAYTVLESPSAYRIPEVRILEEELNQYPDGNGFVQAASCTGADSEGARDEGASGEGFQL